MQADGQLETTPALRPARRRAAPGVRGPVLLPLILVAVGVVLLLDSFLLLGDFNVTALLPLLLVVTGAHILLRGDILPSLPARSFGITRGSVESATLEISAGMIDVQLRRLQREGRLIAGQYAAHSRPSLDVESTHALLRMDRAATPWLSFTDWQMALALDLPWTVYLSSSLGRVRADLSGLIVQEAVIATGIGALHCTLPDEAFGPIQLRSALGDIHVITPPGLTAQITVSGPRSFSLHVDETRYTEIAPGQYATLDAEPDLPVIEVIVRGTFGDAYLL